MRQVVKCVKMVISQIIKECVKVVIELEDVNNANKLQNFVQNVVIIFSLMTDTVYHVEKYLNVKIVYRLCHFVLIVIVTISQLREIVFPVILFITVLNVNRVKYSAQNVNKIIILIIKENVALVHIKINVKVAIDQEFSVPIAINITILI